MNAPLDASETPAAGGTARHALPDDRTWLAALLGGTAAIDAAHHHVEIAEDGDDKAVAVWRTAGSNGIAMLGAVETVGADRRDLFYAAILAACEGMLAEGHTRGNFRVPDRRLVRRIKRDFDERMTPVGRNVKTDQPGHWRLTVDLQDAATKLRRFVQ